MSSARQLALADLHFLLGTLSITFADSRVIAQDEAISFERSTAATRYKILAVGRNPRMSLLHHEITKKRGEEPRKQADLFSSISQIRKKPYNGSCDEIHRTTRSDKQTSLYRRKRIEPDTVRDGSDRHCLATPRPGKKFHDAQTRFLELRH